MSIFLFTFFLSFFLSFWGFFWFFLVKYNGSPFIHLVMTSYSSLTHLFPIHPFSTLWKHQKTLRFSDIFKRWRKGALRTNGVKIKLPSWDNYYSVSNCRGIKQGRGVANPDKFLNWEVIIIWSRRYRRYSFFFLGGGGWLTIEWRGTCSRINLLYLGHDALNNRPISGINRHIHSFANSRISQKSMCV